MPISILHISDLHRDLNDELSNKALIDSLKNDAARYVTENPPIKGSDLCIVSGDLIYGVSESRADFDAESKRQYAQAEDFLARLADEFYHGDRNRVVLIPGNHDVSFPVSYQSFTKIDVPAEPRERGELVGDWWKPRSKLRWSWRDFCFYKISNESLYDKRLSYFAELYDRFYGGTRKFSLSPAEQYEIFDYPDLDLSIAALTSCFENDPLRRFGNIHPDALIGACQELRAPERAGRTKVATWHHHIKGDPFRDDFLDAAFIQHLIGAGVALGLHGHQHAPDCFDERYSLDPNPKKMTVISASTLCASPHHLRPGFPRGYNVIELDVQAAAGLAHQRAMANEMYNAPIWGPGRFQLTNRSYVEFDLPSPLASRKDEITKQLEQVEELIGNKKWPEAISMLKPILSDATARVFMLKALTELQDDEITISALWPPQSNGEIIAVAGALLELNDIGKSIEFLELPVVQAATDSSVITIRQRLQERASR